jgi:hypothetical protein
VHRAEEDIVALVQNALCAVAVVHVDIRNCWLGSAFHQHLRSDRGVIEIAEPAGQIGIDVMT